MIVVCSNCGQNLDGDLDSLEKEIKCPACLQWAYPQLPKVGDDDDSLRPEKLGQARLEELVNAADDVEAWRDRRRKRRRTRRQAQPVTPPRPAEDQWYVLTASGPKGPFSSKAIMQFARTGKINKANRLKNARSGAEVRAGDVPNLFSAPPAADDGWYVQTPKGNAGPFTNEQIIAFARAGKIAARTMLRYGQTGRFVAADTVRGLGTEYQSYAHNERSHARKFMKQRAQRKQRVRSKQRAWQPNTLRHLGRELAMAPGR